MSSASSENCITENKTKPRVSDVDKHTNGAGTLLKTSFDPNSPISVSGSLYFNIEQEILGINQKNVDQIFNKIQENMGTFSFVTNFIEYALKIRPNQTESLISLLSKLSKVYKYTPSNHMTDERRNILIKKGIIKEKPLYHEKVKLFEEGSVEEAIKEDSVDKLIKITAQHDFNPKGTLIINRNQSLYFVTEEIHRDCYLKKDIEVTYMQLMAYFGSVKCFKYALIDGSFDDSAISEYAVAGGNVEIIHLLEQKGVSFDGCFEVSVKFHRYEISEWLFRNYECNIELKKICEYYNNRMLLFCIQNKIDFTKDSINQSLFSSSDTGNVDLVKYLVEHCHANVETKNNYSRLTPLNYASYSGHIDVVKYLVEHCHANVETKDKNGRTPLNNASEWGHIEVVKYLVEHCQADVETEDNYKITPLINASKYGRIEVVKYLVEHCHAYIETKNNEGDTPLSIASRYGRIDVVKYLIEHCHAYIETKDEYGSTPLNNASCNGLIEVVKCLIEHCHAYVETKNNDVNISLNSASIYGHIEVVKYIIEHCHADVEAKNKNGNTPLNSASIYGHIEVVKYLVEHCHADVETKNKNGMTSLNSASYKGHIEVVKYLVENGAKVTQKDLRYGNSEIKKYLREHIN